MCVISKYILALEIHRNFANDIVRTVSNIQKYLAFRLNCLDVVATPKMTHDDVTFHTFLSLLKMLLHSKLAKL